MTKLTTKQKECLLAIRDHWIRYGVPPSLGDLTDNLQKSKTAVYSLVKSLEKKGWIKSDKGIKVTGMRILLPPFTGGTTEKEE